MFGVETIELDLPTLAGTLTRLLRDRGVPITPGRSADFARALTLVRPVARRQLYWTARAVFVSDPAQVDAFDAVFFSVFGNRPAGDDVVPEDVPTVASPSDDRPASEHKTSPRDANEPEPRAGFAATAPNGRDDDEAAEVEVPLALASSEELLRSKSFDTLEPYELAQLFRLMTRLELATPLRRTRRYKKGHHGERIDLRRTLRASLRTGGDPIRLARRRRRIVRRRLVLLCDISGSMEPYARAYLQFLTCAAGSGPNAEAFVFATRLTRVTRALASRNPERAIQRAAAAAPDWSSGTRIGDALREFNGREMQRLARLAHRIVWVNPRVGAGAFSVQAGGMVAALPHCDAFVSGHSFEALGEVVEAIGASSWQRSTSWTAPGVEERQEDEPWASATPVPGSSVGMPSGHGPSRGNTTPGWVTDE